MVWAKAALVGGLLVLCAAFAVGVEHPQSAVVDGQTRACGAAISASWLVSGTPDRTSPGPAGTSVERRAAAACRPTIRQARALLVTGMGVGGLAALVGWSAIVRRDETRSRPIEGSFALPGASRS